MALRADDWQRVFTIARELAGEGVDRNELGKVVSYFRQERSKAKFLALLKRLPNSEFIRSNRTKDYFNQIHSICTQQLRGLNDQQSLAVVSWAFRLMTYYQVPFGKRYR